MPIEIQQIALDSLAGDEQAIINELNGRTQDLEFLQRYNTENRTTEHEGCGIRFRANDQQFSDEVFIARDKREISKAYHSVAQQIANDDVAYSIPNNGVLQFATTIFNNKLIKQILKSTPLRQLTTDWQQGMFGTTDVNVPTVSYEGEAQLYSDDSGQGDSAVNYNWVPRQIVTLERTLKYGDLTQAQFSMAKLDYVGDKRTGLTSLTNLDINAIGFSGYAGMNIYGLLNDPSLNPYIVAPASIANPASSLWFYKTFDEIIFDIQSMFDDIIGRAGGQADYTMPCTLGLPPSCWNALTKINSLGTQTVKGYCDIVYPGLKFIQVPNYQGTGSPFGSVVPNKAQLIYDNLGGEQVAYNLFASLYNSHGMVRQLSSYAEKISYAIGGAFIALPIAVASITGI